MNKLKIFSVKKRKILKIVERSIRFMS